jgi:hypothetical protein
MKQLILVLALLTFVLALQADIVINEIMYNTPSYDNEWIELYNTSASAVDLSGWQVVDDDLTHTHLVIDSGSIPGNGYFTIAITHDAQAETFPFTPDYDGTGTDLGWALANGGDTITLLDDNDATIDLVVFDDAAPWPTQPDGNGPSLELTDPAQDNNAGANWHASSTNGGTPGEENSGGGGGDYTDVATVAALRAGAQDGTVYRLTGEAILTYQQEFRFQKYVQDATGGILIDESGTASVFANTYSIGDGITGLIGTITDYNGMLEFAPTQDAGPATSTGNAVTPEVVTLAQLTASFDTYESELIKINNVSFDVTGSFAAGTVYSLHDPTASFSFRTTFYDSDYIGTAIPTAPCNLIVLPNARSNVNYITSRETVDFVFDVNDPVLSINPSPINFGLVNDGQPYTQQITLTNSGGAALTLDTITPPTAEFTVTGVTLPLNLAVAGTATATVNLTPDYGRFTGNIVFAGNFGSYNLPVSYAPNVPASGVIINEIMYNTTSYDNEWVELYNADASEVSLAGWSLVDSDNTHDLLVIPDGFSIPAGGYFTISIYHDAQAVDFPFTPDFDGAAISTWNLNNSSDTIHLYDANSTEVDIVDYQSASPWPSEPNGQGQSLELINPALDNNLGASWQASAVEGGSPGEANSGGIQIINVGDLSELRAQTPGTSQQYRVTGNVVMTFQQTYMNQKYFQDGAAGILIFDPNAVITTNYNIGDVVANLTGTLDTYNGMMEFVPSSDPGTPVSTGATLYPIVVDIPTLTDNFASYQSELVALNDVTFQETGQFANGFYYTLADEQGTTFQFYTNFYDVDYIGTDIPTDPVHVVGLAINYNDTCYITARDAADIAEGQPASDHNVPSAKTALLGAYPNPFNPTTHIRFSLAQAGQTELVVYNLQGQKIRNLVSDVCQSGAHEALWNGMDDNSRPVASGVYLYRLKSGSFTSTGKAIMLK